MSKSDVLYLRVPKELAQRVKNAAENDGKSVNLYITNLLANQLNIDLIKKNGELIIQDRINWWEEQNATIRKTHS